MSLGYFSASYGSATQSDDLSLDVVTAPAPERTHIVIKDSDEDGIPDWQEQFQQMKPVRVLKNASSTHASTSVNTLTGEIAVDLLTDVIKRKTRGPYGTSQESSLRNASEKIAEAGTDTLYTESALTTSDNTTVEALRFYGNNIAAIMTADLIPEGTRSELVIVGEAVEKDDEAMLQELDSIVSAYKTARDTMLTMTVPETMTKEHLLILNAYHALMVDTEAMQEAFTDPLYSMTRLKRYQDDVRGLEAGIVGLYRSLHDAGVRWNKTDTVSKILTVKE